MFQYVANYYFNLLQVSSLLQNVCTSNFRTLILLSSISLFLRHWISSFFLFISYILTEISPLFKSCLIVSLQSFCDGFDKLETGLMFRKQRWWSSLRCITIRQLTIILSSLMKWTDSPLYSVGYTRTEGGVRSRL